MEVYRPGEVRPPLLKNTSEILKVVSGGLPVVVICPNFWGDDKLQYQPKYVKIARKPVKLDTSEFVKEAYIILSYSKFAAMDGIKYLVTTTNNCFEVEIKSPDIRINHEFIKVYMPHIVEEGDI